MIKKLTSMTNLRQRFKLIVLIVLTQLALQGQTAKRKQHFNLSSSVAINGYDPVSYFTKNKAEKGSKTINTTYDGVIYYFASTNNKDAFIKSPQSYEPQYGGWCAYAMGAKGEKVEVDPETFKLVNGKLYLFYNSFFNNTRNSWNENEAELKSKADLNWKKITN